MTAIQRSRFRYLFGLLLFIVTLVVFLGSGGIWHWFSKMNGGSGASASLGDWIESQPMNDLNGMICTMSDQMELPGNLMAAGLTTFSQMGGSTATPRGGGMRPLRTIQDPYSTFAGIAVDPINDEVVMSDENRFNLLVYGRGIRTEGIAEPRRRVGGLRTKIEFICGVTIDPVSREIFTVNNDVLDNLLVFSQDQNGDVTPARELAVDHGAWGVALDREHDEVAITIQHTNKVTVYRRTAQGEEKALRIIQGAKTELADPHGIFVDSKNNEIFVANHVSWHLAESRPNLETAEESLGQRPQIRPLIPSTGRFQMPSITVYSRAANGDVAPLRIIRGPKTRLNMPLGISVDTDRGEIAVANDGGNSILFFSRTASGDVEPSRVIEGPATGLKNPAGVAIDAKNDEIWVSNWGNHSATVYSRAAQGNATPLRTIRSAPRNAPLPGLGNIGGVAYDSKRDQLLVPN